MGGFYVSTQPFGIYQAIHWLCDRRASLTNVINATRRIRGMIEKGKTDDIVQLGIVTRLFELLDRTSEEVVKTEVVWTLINIAAGSSSQTEIVLRKGLPMFAELLLVGSIELKNDVILAFSNIAGDSMKFRDKLLDAGILSKVLNLMVFDDVNLELHKNCSWFISNMSRYPDLGKCTEQISSCIPTVARFMQHDDIDVLKNICWTLKYLTDGKGNTNASTLIDLGVCKSLVDLLSNNLPTLMVVVLLVTVNISSGSNSEMQSLLDCGLIPILKRLLDESNDQSVLKYTCLTISNIAAGSTEHIEMLVGNNIYQKMSAVFHASDTRVKKEVLHVLSNTISCGNAHQVIHLNHVGGLEIIEIGIMMNDEVEALQVSLDALLNLKRSKHFELKMSGLTSSY